MDSKTNADLLKSMANDIRILYQSDASVAERLIEGYLENRFKGYAPGKKMDFLQKLSRHFEGLPTEKPKEHTIDSEEFAGLLSLLLGDRVSHVDLSSPEQVEKLAKSLNTVFDSVNRIIRVIHRTLLGKQEELETIRGIISSDLAKGEETDSLQGYLDQIQEAFIVAHRAFQEAALTKVRRMLDELDPKRISSLTEGSLKFGPFRKAALFEIYEDTFQDCQGWFESGRFMEELLREFEKKCNKLYKTGASDEKES
jgi:hypothetical protein